MRKNRNPGYTQLARLPCGNGTRLVPLGEIQIDDVVIVAAEETIAIDGTIVVGAGVIDESMITGEYVAERTVGDQVYASTVLLQGALEILVERIDDQNRNQIPASAKRKVQ
ncbi:hypothetical protein [Stieleria marina]